MLRPDVPAPSLVVLLRCTLHTPQEAEIYARTLGVVSELEMQYGALWTACQRCQGSLHMDVLCTSRDCPIFYRWVFSIRRQESPVTLSPYLRCTTYVVQHAALALHGMCAVRQGHGQRRAPARQPACSPASTALAPDAPVAARRLPGADRLACRRKKVQKDLNETAAQLARFGIHDSGGAAGDEDCCGGRRCCSSSAAPAAPVKLDW
jgi:hypothetical protein